MPRYLLCRPLGGMNGQLEQAETCWRYAERHDRRLVLDTSRAGLQEDLFRYFRTLPSEVVQPHSPHDPVLPDFDTLPSVRPAALRGRVSSYTARRRRDLRRYVDSESGELLSFDLKAAHPEDLLVHEQAGGGADGIHLLERVQFTPETANAIVDRLSSLPSRFGAAHIRHTDYRADLPPFLAELERLAPGGSLVVCSDNRRTIDFVREAVGQRVTVLTVSDVPDLDGRSIHGIDAVPDRHLANIDLLSDLMALAAGRPLLVCSIENGRLGDGRVSGFSVLARRLNKRRWLSRRLLAPSDNRYTARRLFGRLPPFVYGLLARGRTDARRPIDPN
jgi:hypothetical protein